MADFTLPAAMIEAAAARLWSHLAEEADMGEWAAAEEDERVEARTAACVALTAALSVCGVREQRGFESNRWGPEWHDTGLDGWFKGWLEALPAMYRPLGRRLVVTTPAEEAADG